MELATRNKVQFVWMPRIEGNEFSDRMAKEETSCPFIGPEPALTGYHGLVGSSVPLPLSLFLD